MPQFRRPELEFVLQTIASSYEDSIVGLKRYHLSGKKVVNFGCGGGYETVALMWFLDAEEVVGVDRTLCHLRNYALSLREWINESKEALPYAFVSEKDIDWWHNQVPRFLRGDRFPRFVQKDMVHPTEHDASLRDEYYDLAFCSNVLSHIHRDHGIEGAKMATKEMGRVVKPQGWIVASEPDDPSLHYFSSFFDQVQKEGGKIIYTCQKT